MSSVQPEFVSTALARGWITCAAGDGFNAVAYQKALHAGYVDMEAHILARMSRTEVLPLLTSTPDVPALAFAPLFTRDLGLYVIVDSSVWVERVLAAGVRTVQLRMKDVSLGDLRAQIKRSIAMARQCGAQLFINDHWQIAVEEGAYGIHIGQEDLEELTAADLARIAHAGLRLGISTHAYFEVCRALAVRPSYIACGPIHPTKAKAMPWLPQGNDNLAYWCSKLAAFDVPVVAIAGMDEARSLEAMQCGAASVALISAVTASADPEGKIAKLQAAIALGKTLAKRPPPQWARPTLKSASRPA